MSEYDRSKNLGRFLHQRKEPVEAPAAVEAEAPKASAIGEKFRSLKSVDTKQVSQPSDARLGRQFSGSPLGRRG